MVDKNDDGEKPKKKQNDALNIVKSGAESVATGTVKKSVEKQINKQVTKTMVKGAGKLGAKVAAEPLKDVPVVGIGLTAMAAAGDLTNITAAAHGATHGDKKAQKAAIEGFINIIGAGVGAVIGGVVAGVAGAGAGAATGAVEGGVVAGAAGTVVTAPIGGIEGAVVGGAGGATVGAVAQGGVGALLGVVVGAGEGAAFGQTIAGVISPTIAKAAQFMGSPVFDLAGKASDKLNEKTGFDALEKVSNFAKFVQPVTNLANDPLSALSHLKEPFKKIAGFVSKKGEQEGVDIGPANIEKELNKHFVKEHPQEGAKLSKFLTENNAAANLDVAIDKALGSKKESKKERKQEKRESSEPYLTKLVEKQPSFTKQADQAFRSETPSAKSESSEEVSKKQSETIKPKM